MATTGPESHADRPGLPYSAGESISSVVSVIVAVSFFRREELHIDIGHVPAVTQYPEVHYLLFLRVGPGVSYFQESVIVAVLFFTSALC